MIKNSSAILRILKSSFVYFALPIFLGLLALAPWINSPIYPDEIAMRIQLGRYFQDNGIFSGLFQLCQSNYRNISGISIIPASAISYFDEILSFTQFRYISVALIISIVGSVSYINVDKKNFTHLSILIGFIGISGSSLIFARYELFQVFNILVCIIIYIIYKNINFLKLVRLFAAILLFLSYLLSVYSHTQGLLLLPLNIYCIYLLLNNNRISSVIIVLLSFLFLLYLGISFNQWQCQEHPSIVQYISRMTFGINDVFTFNFYKSLILKFLSFYRSFSYLNTYPINYLPGIESDAWFYPNILNIFIIFLLIINLIFLLIFILFFIKSVLIWFLGGKFKNPHDYFFILLLLFPAITLFIFDPVFNFYRIIFINFLLGICTSLFFSKFNLSFRFKFSIYTYVFLLSVLIIFSAFINFNFFSYKFIENKILNSPSISSYTDWKSLDERIYRVALRCGVNFIDGGIIVDDLSFGSLKKFPKIFPLTYIALQADILKISVDDAILALQPNYVIARCSYMEGTKIGFPETVRDGEICCRNLKSGY